MDRPGDDGDVVQSLPDLGHLLTDPAHGFEVAVSQCQPHHPNQRVRLSTRIAEGPGDVSGLLQVG